jgi:hypothetical protein
VDVGAPVHRPIDQAAGRQQRDEDRRTHGRPGGPRVQSVDGHGSSDQRDRSDGGGELHRVVAVRDAPQRAEHDSDDEQPAAPEQQAGARGVAAVTAAGQQPAGDEADAGCREQPARPGRPGP